MQGGPVEFDVNTSGPVTFWVDEEPYEKQGRAVATLTPGRHRITVRQEIGSGPAPTLKVEVRRPAASRAHFELPRDE